MKLTEDILLKCNDIYMHRAFSAEKSCHSSDDFLSQRTIFPTFTMFEIMHLVQSLKPEEQWQEVKTEEVQSMFV